MRLGMLLVSLMFGCGAAAAEGAHVALVIGTGAYASLPPLGGCEASARVVSAALRRAGFEVTELLSPANAAMGAALSAFGDRVAPGAVGVVYVCGYAAAAGGRVFLLPASARVERETDLPTQAVVARLLGRSLVGRDGLMMLDLVGLPGHRDSLAVTGMLEGTGGGVGLVAAQSLVTPGGGATPLAAAVSEALGGGHVEAQALLRGVGAAMADTPGLSVAVQAPERPVWLVGAAPVVAAPEPAPDAAATVRRAPASEEDWRRVQGALKRLGYYAGQVDGRTGPETAAAIRRFQNELGQGMTGVLTDGQVSRLLAPR